MKIREYVKKTERLLLQAITDSEKNHLSRGQWKYFDDWLAKMEWDMDKNPSLRGFFKRVYSLYYNEKISELKLYLQKTIIK